MFGTSCSIVKSGFPIVLILTSRFFQPFWCLDSQFSAGNRCSLHCLPAPSEAPTFHLGFSAPLAFFDYRGWYLLLMFFQHCVWTNHDFHVIDDDPISHNCGWSSSMNSKWWFCRSYGKNTIWKTQSARDGGHGYPPYLSRGPDLNVTWVTRSNPNFAVNGWYTNHEQYQKANR